MTKRDIDALLREALQYGTLHKRVLVSPYAASVLDLEEDGDGRWISGAYGFRLPVRVVPDWSKQEVVVLCCDDSRGQSR